METGGEGKESCVSLDESEDPEAPPNSYINVVFSVNCTEHFPFLIFIMI